MEAQSTLLALMIILTLGLIIPEVLKRISFPIISLIILAGAVFGPNGFNYVGLDPTIEFLGFLGMTFLMLMAGLDTDLARLQTSKMKITIMVLMNGLIPFMVGFGIIRYFGYDMTSSLLVGIIFISSSVAIIIPYLDNNKIIEGGNAQIILASVLVADVISLILLGILFQNIQPITTLPLPLYFLYLFLSIPLLFYFIPRLSDYVLRKRFTTSGAFEQRLRFVLVVVMGTLVFFTILGVHPILGAFLAGLSLSGIVRKDESGILHAKLHTLGYGMFVPTFFFIVGMDLDLALLKQFDFTNVIMISVIFGLILSKLITGYAAGRFVDFSHKDSLLFGSISITQLTTTLAVTYAAASLNLLDSVLVTSIILLAVISTFLGPLLASYVSSKQL